MKAKISILLVLLFFAFVPLSHAYSINVDEIIYQPDTSIDLSNYLDASVKFAEITDPFNKSFQIQLTNLTPNITTGDIPAIAFLTGIGFNLTNTIVGGSVSAVNYSESDDPSMYWGFDIDVSTGPFANETALSVNTSVSTLEAAVAANCEFAAGGVIDGPKHGVLSNFYSGPYSQPYFQPTVFITINLNNSVSDWNSFFEQVDMGDVVVSFGSPTASTVPEPTTLLLLGLGLIGLAGFRRR